MRRTVPLLALFLALATAGSLATAGEPLRVATLLPYVADALQESHGPARVVASVRAALARLTRGRPVATLTLFGAPGSFLAVTPRTWLGDLLEQGFRNVATVGLGKESQPGYLELNDEVMASLRPSSSSSSRMGIRAGSSWPSPA